MSTESGRVSPTLMFVVFFLVAMASLIGDHDGGGWQPLFWASATCSAAAFQVGIAPRRTTPAAVGAGAGWLVGMVAVGAAIMSGGIGVWFLSLGASEPLGFVGIIAIVVGIAWSLAAVLHLVVKLLVYAVTGAR